MRRFLYTIVVAVVLVVLGFIIASFVQNRSLLLATRDDIMSPAIPTALAGFPDIEHVPVYPNATITKAAVQSVDFRHIVYEVRDSTDAVAKFYQETLPKKGWLFRTSRVQSSLYSWTDPAGKSPWHLHLEVTVGFTLDESKTLVNINYGRYPDVEEGLPIYSDAVQVTTTRSKTEKSPTFDFPAHITDISYLSARSPREIEEFYNNSLLEYGWSFFDRSGAGTINKQTGDITSEEGLYFRAGRIGWDMKTSVSYHLFITATAQGDGQTSVKLHLEELDISNAGP